MKMSFSDHTKLVDLDPPSLDTLKGVNITHFYFFFYHYISYFLAVVNIIQSFYHLSKNATFKDILLCYYFFLRNEVGYIFYLYDGQITNRFQD